MLALLLCCTIGEAERTKTVDKPIVPILIQLAVGSFTESQNQFGPTDFSLEIDGKPSNSWLYAAFRVAAYVFNITDTGEIAYKYHLWYQKLSILRQTIIKNDALELITTVHGDFGPVHKVIFYITAEQNNHQTLISARAVGYTTLGKHCRLVRRIASKEITKALDEVLATVDREGTKLYREADLLELTDVFIRKLANESVLGSPPQFRVFPRRSRTP